MKTDRIRDEEGVFKRILEISKKENLSFYDASYIYFLKEKGLIFVTEDKKLGLKASKYVKFKQHPNCCQNRACMKQLNSF